jgi:hypothetical protein
VFVQTTIKIPFDAFEEKYGLIKNHLDANASFDGVLFETYETELAFVLAQKNNHIWTFQEDDYGVPCVTNGYHYVNRLGYFITKKPWNDGEEFYINLL